jgi:glutamate-1-semialdehyde 2,1-aminomutase
LFIYTEHCYWAGARGKPLRLHRSEEITETLRAVLPGGDTRTSTFFRPFPIVMERGDGFRLWDVDGNEYVDLLNNFTSLVHGHSHPKIVDAVCDQAPVGLSFSAPHRSQGELADRIVDRFDSIERVRFTNSGTEAVMQAIRAARAVTGRDRIVKAYGGYHGSWEQVPMVPENSLGTPQVVRGLIEWVDYNDVTQLKRTMSEKGDEIAALILEPVMGGGGVVEATRDYIEAARRLTKEHGTLLILDEVITLRLGPGGCQGLLGVDADITTMGKIIGGGLPVGALGGSADVMEVFDPRRASYLDHGGTFNGNPMTMAAGCASLDLLSDEQIEKINALGANLADRFKEVFVDASFPVSVTNVGSLLQLHLGTSGEIRNYKDVNLAEPLLDRFHAACLEEGIYFARRGLLNVSTAMDEVVIGRIAEGAKRALDRMDDSEQQG